MVANGRKGTHFRKETDGVGREEGTISVYEIQDHTDFDFLADLVADSVIYVSTSSTSRILGLLIIVSRKMFQQQWDQQPASLCTVSEKEEVQRCRHQ